MPPETPPSSVADPPLPRLRLGAAPLAIMVLCSAVELTLIAADRGLVGTVLWRGLAYQNGAFWAGLLHNWRPNYAAQPWLMFVTYAFLHGGFWHLAGNMLTLAALAPHVTQRAGQGGFLVIYGLSAIGGAAGFALLTRSPQPMVGASGALFGLAGALIWWNAADRWRRGLRLWPVWGMILVLAALNAGMWVMLKGVLAWETHLAGFVAGGVAAWAWGRVRPG